MTIINLSRELQIPENKEGYEQEDILNKHERYLRILMKNKFTPIYLGDIVEVGEDCIEKKKNQYTEEVGVVVGIEPTLQSAFNIDYLSYTIEQKNGKRFETNYNSLKLINQAKGNKLLVKLLQESNSDF